MAADAFIQIPVDGAGKKVRTEESSLVNPVTGAESVVETQVVAVEDDGERLKVVELLEDIKGILETQTNLLEKLAECDLRQSNSRKDDRQVSNISRTNRGA